MRTNPTAALLLPLPLAFAFLTGCASPPPRQDAMANLESGTPAPYAGTTAALLYSQNTKAALTYLRKANWGQFDGDGVIAAVTSPFAKNFKRVDRAETLEQAKASGADLIVVFDFYAEISNNKFTPSRMDAGAVILAPDGRQIDTLKTHVESYMSWTALTRPLGRSVDKGASDVKDQLESQLLASTKVQEFIAARASAPAAPVAAAKPREISSDIDAPPSRGAERPDDFALVIGIEDYQSVPRADYGARDAKTVRRHLEALGFPSRNIIALTGPEATGSKLRSYLEEWLPLNVKAN
jgi:hypothetical protein